MAVTQIIRKEIKDEMDKAQKYYTIISIVNSLSLSERELQLLAFVAVKKHISYKEYKQEFCSLYDSSLPTVHNMISKLTRMGVLMRENKKVKINPKILLPFQEEIILHISLCNG
jgi:predicted transcriptional regulator